MPLIRLFLDLCLFRKGPQDVPASGFLLYLVLFAYGLASVVLAALETPWQEGLAQVALEGCTLLAFVWFSLWAAGKTGRLLQTMIGLLGTDALISGLAIPVETVSLADPQAGLPHLSLLLLMLWHIGVVGHILRHALSQSLAVGLGLSIVYAALSVQILVLLFGLPQAAG